MNLGGEIFLLWHLAACPAGLLFRILSYIQVRPTRGPAVCCINVTAFFVPILTIVESSPWVPPQPQTVPGEARYSWDANCLHGSEQRQHLWDRSGEPYSSHGFSLQDFC